MSPKILAAALLWLRNHYEVNRPDVRDDVIETIDRVLKTCHPTMDDMNRFMEFFGKNEE